MSPSSKAELKLESFIVSPKSAKVTKSRKPSLYRLSAKPVHLDWQTWEELNSSLQLCFLVDTSKGLRYILHAQKTITIQKRYTLHFPHKILHHKYVEDHFTVYYTPLCWLGSLALGKSPYGFTYPINY